MHLAYIWIVSHLSAKNYRNWWKFDEVLTKTNLLSFFWDTVYSLQGVILQETVEMPKTETNSSEKFEHNLQFFYTNTKVQVLEHLEKVKSLKGKLNNASYH